MNRFLLLVLFFVAVSSALGFQLSSARNGIVSYFFKYSKTNCHNITYYGAVVDLNLILLKYIHFLTCNQISKNQLVMRERKCDLSGARRNSKCMSVSKSNAHTHRVQNVNLQTKKLFWEEGNKYVRIRISTKTLKTIQKKGLHATAKDFGVDLNKFSISAGSTVTESA